MCAQRKFITTLRPQFSHLCDVSMLHVVYDECVKKVCSHRGLLLLFYCVVPRSTQQVLYSHSSSSYALTKSFHRPKPLLKLSNTVMLWLIVKECAKFFFCFGFLKIKHWTAQQPLSFMNLNNTATFKVHWGQTLFLLLFLARAIDHTFLNHIH